MKSHIEQYDFCLQCSLAQNANVNLHYQKPVKQYRTRQTRQIKETNLQKKEGINKCILFTVFFDGSQAVSTLPTSCMSWSWRSCDRVWCLRASCRGVSPSLSWISSLAPARTKSWKEREPSLKFRKRLFIPFKTDFRKLWFRMLQKVLKGYSFILLQFTVGFLKIHFPYFELSLKWRIHLFQISSLFQQKMLACVLRECYKSCYFRGFFLLSKTFNSHKIAYKQCNILQQYIRNRTSGQHFRYVYILNY